MGRYLEAKCKLCRRADMKLFLKGTRCITEKCSFAKRPTPPGATSNRRRSKPSYYSLQLREKQKVKQMYGMLEKQFKRFFFLASKSRGATGKVLIQLLERRIDNVIYRSLLALSRNQARQIVRHGFVLVDGKRVSIPSYMVKEGEKIEIKAKDSFKQSLKESYELNAKDRSVPSWIEMNKDNFSMKIIRFPEKEDLVLPVDEQLIVELYSK